VRLRYVAVLGCAVLADWKGEGRSRQRGVAERAEGFRTGTPVVAIPVDP
jgi:hypothetical protein